MLRNGRKVNVRQRGNVFRVPGRIMRQSGQETMVAPQADDVPADGDDIVVADEGAAAPAAAAADPDMAGPPLLGPRPVRPSPDKVAQHELTHLPFAAWCPVCVCGRAADAPHVRRLPDESTEAVVEADYAYLGAGVGLVTLLVATDMDSGAVFATQTPLKGQEGLHAIRSMVAWLNELGLKRLTLQTDGEAALIKWAEFVKRESSLTINLRQSPLESSQSNGGAERAVRTVKDMTRTLIEHVRVRCGVYVSTTHTLHSWAVRHAAWLVTRFQPHGGGKETSWFRLRGRPYSSPVYEFAEAVMVRFPGATSRARSRWAKGVFVGKVDSTDEVVVLTENGMIRSRAVRRMPQGEEYDVPLIGRVRGLPWSTSGHDTRRVPRQNPVVGQFPVRASPSDEIPSHGMDMGAAAAADLASDVPSASAASAGRTHGEERGERDGTGDRDDGVFRARIATDSATPGTRSRSRGGSNTPRGDLDSEAERVERAALSASPSMNSDVPDSADLHMDSEDSLPLAVASSGLRRPADTVPDGAPEGVRRRLEMAMGREVAALVAEKSYIPSVDDPAETRNVRDVAIMYLDQEVDDLDPIAIHEGRLNELAQMERFGVYEVVKLQDAKSTGARIWTHRWVDRPKGDVVRSRLVVREFAKEKRVDCFAAATSPATVNLISWWAVKNGYGTRVADVSVAFLHADETENNVFVTVPDEFYDYAGLDDAEEVVWRLRKQVYGRRKAPAAWQDYAAARLMGDCGFQRSEAAPTLFYNHETKVLVVLRVDDFYAAGPSKGLTRMYDELVKHMLMKVGPEIRVGGDFEFLRAKYRREAEGLRVTPSEKYLDKCLADLGLEDGRSVRNPGLTLKDEPWTKEDLRDDDAATYRRCVGRLLYLSHTRFDIQYHVRTLCQDVKKPKGGSWAYLKHLVRYLHGCRGRSLFFPEAYRRRNDDDGALKLIAFSDSDWAGTHRPERKSVSAGVVMLDGCQLTCWSRTQGTTALSSGEAEFLAAIVASVELLGVTSILAEFSMNVEAEVRTDSNVCRAILSRLGSGKLKHLETRFFAVQQWVKKGRLTIARVPGVENPADLGTKSLAETTIRRLLQNAGMRDGDEYRNELKALAAIQATEKKHSSAAWSPGALAALAALLSHLPVVASQAQCETCLVRPNALMAMEPHVWPCVIATLATLLLFSLLLSFVVGVAVGWMVCSTWNRGAPAKAATVESTAAGVELDGGGGVAPGGAESQESTAVPSGRTTKHTRLSSRRLVVSPAGQKFHTTAECAGLTNASSTRELGACLYCVRD